MFDDLFSLPEPLRERSLSHLRAARKILLALPDKTLTMPSPSCARAASQSEPGLSAKALALMHLGSGLINRHGVPFDKAISLARKRARP